MMRNFKFICVSLIFFAFGCGSGNDYLGQEPPGEEALVFAPDFISKKGTYDFSGTFSPDFTEYYFTRRASGSEENRILCSKKQNGQWTAPQAADFAVDAFEFDPYITPEGNTLYFSSERKAEEHSGINIWKLEKKQGTWSKAELFNSKISDEFAAYITSTEKGKLYFTGNGGIHYANLLNGKYEKPNRCGNAINYLERPAHPYIAPDESYLIFDAQSLVNYRRKSELYISFKGTDGKWTKAVKMNEKINHPDFEQNCPSVSPDGKYLFFCRFKDEEGDIFWIDASVIDEHRP